MTDFKADFSNLVALLKPKNAPLVREAQPNTVLLPLKDTGKTWGGPDSKRELNFGHHPKVDDTGKATLLSLHASGVIVWADIETALTPDQWVNMPKFQQDSLLQLLPPMQRASFQQRMDKGDGRKSHTQPQGIDNSQVSPFTVSVAQFNREALAPAAVAERARLALAGSR